MISINLTLKDNICPLRIDEDTNNSLCRVRKELCPETRRQYDDLFCLGNERCSFYKDGSAR